MRVLNPAEFYALAPHLVTIHLHAMHYSAALQDSRIAAWRRDIGQPGFRAVCAIEGSYVSGVAYGFRGSASTPWHRHVAAALAQHDPAATQILRSYVELAELHVSPSRQRRGIGEALMMALLQELWSTSRAARVLLSTPEVPGEGNSAFGFYRRHGFSDVVRHCHFPGDERPFAILGRRLPLSPPGGSATATEDEGGGTGQVS